MRTSESGSVVYDPIPHRSLPKPTTPPSCMASSIPNPSPCADSSSFPCYSLLGGREVAQSIVDLAYDLPP